MTQRFLDPLYGRVTVDADAMRFVFSPEFQRLRYVRLCNINSLFLTGASEPKRFEHCLGVYHLADRWAELRGLGARESSVVKRAALVHDLQTGPFGHSFQYVLEDNPFVQRFEHADLSAGVRDRFLQRTGAAAAFAGRPFSVKGLLGDTAPEVFAAVDGKGPYGPLIAGSLDLDNLDNVVRLAFHMGLCDDADRRLPLDLLPLMDVQDGRLAVRRGGSELLQRWFDLRRRLYEYLLLDRGEFAAKAMLTLAVEEAAAAGLIGPDSWRLTDEELLDELRVASTGNHQHIGRIVQRLRLGDLFDCIDVWSSTTTACYEELSQASTKRRLEAEIETEATRNGRTTHRVCLHPILDKKKTRRLLRYRDIEDGSEKQVGSDSNELLIGVFVTNARTEGVNGLARQRQARAAREVLARFGIADLRQAPEPLALASDPQNEFFA